MSSASASPIDRFIDAIRRFFSAQPETAPPPDAVPRAAAVLLMEVARADSDIGPQDLGAAREALQRLFAMAPERADALLEHARRRENRPTSYFPIVSLLNDRMSPEDKVALIEQMWRVANVDHEIDMYEDHIVRKISDLLYVPHRDFIIAKHRARSAAS